MKIGFFRLFWSGCESKTKEIDKFSPLVSRLTRIATKKPPDRDRMFCSEDVRLDSPYAKTIEKLENLRNGS